MTPPASPRDGDDGSVDVEAAWADIVAHWNTQDDPVGRWPASEDTDDAQDTGKQDTGTSEDDQTTAQPPDGVDDAADWGPAASHVGGEPSREAAGRADVDEDDADEGFVPPEPPPLPHGDLYTRLAWGGVLGAPLFFLVTALFWRSVPQILIMVGVVAFVAGFVALVMRMPDHRDPDDHDDGAVV